MSSLHQVFADRAWASPHAHTVSRPDLSYGVSAVDMLDVNCVTHASADADLPALVREVSHAHAAVRSRWQLPCANPAELGALLSAAGYAVKEPALELRRWCSAHVEQPGSRYTVEPVRTPEALRAWHEVRRLAGRSASLPSEASQRAELSVALGSRHHYTHFLAWSDGEPVAAGALWVASDLRAGALCGGAVALGHRGQGAYRALIDRRIAHLRAMASAGGREDAEVLVCAMAGESQRVFTHLGFHSTREFLLAERPVLT